MYCVLVMKDNLIVAYQTIEDEAFEELKSIFKKIYYVLDYIIAVINYESLSDEIIIARKV